MAKSFNFDTGYISVTSGYDSHLKITGSIERTSSTKVKISAKITSQYNMQASFVIHFAYGTTQKSFSGDYPNITNGYTEISGAKKEVTIETYSSTGTTVTIHTDKEVTVPDDELYFAVWFTTPSYYNVDAGYQDYNVIGGKSISSKLDRYYTAPTNHKIEVTSRAVRSLTVKHSWTAGSNSITTKTLQVYSNDTEPVYKSKVITVSNGSTYKFDDEEASNTSYEFQPNRLYTIKSIVSDGTTKLEKTITERTNVGKPTGLSAKSAESSLKVKATSNNMTTNLSYKYTMEYQTGGTATKTATSGSYAEFEGSGLRSNALYNFTVIATNTDNERVSSESEYSVWTKPDSPSNVTVTQTTNSITLKATSSNKTDNLSYKYTITDKNGTNVSKTAAHDTSVTFDNLDSNSSYKFSVVSVNTATTGINNGQTSDSAYASSAWTKPVLDSLTLSLEPGLEHNQINAVAKIATRSNYDQYVFTILGARQPAIGVPIMSFKNRDENTSYTIKVYVENTESGFASKEISESITTWYVPIYDLSVVLTNQWYWRLGIKPDFKYHGTISKYEYSITTNSTPTYETGNTIYIKGTTIGGDTNNLKYNTDYNCSIKLTDNHGRTAEVKNTVYKTLDERPLYVDGSLKEVKVIKPNGTVTYITPDLLNVIQENGTVINMNDIINPERYTEK